MATERFLYIVPARNVTSVDDGTWYFQAHDSLPYAEEGPFATVCEAIKAGRETLESEWGMNWPRDSYQISVDE